MCCTRGGGGGKHTKCSDHGGSSRLSAVAFRSYKRSAERDAMPHAAMTPNTPWLLVRLRAPFEPPVALALALDVLEPLGEVAEALAAEPEADALLDALEVGAGAPV